MKIEIGKFHQSPLDGPEGCQSCKEELNAHRGWIKIRKLKIGIFLCQDCIDKLLETNNEK